MATRFKLNFSAADINPGAEDERTLGLTTSSNGQTATTNTATGPTAGVQATPSAGGTVMTWFSKRLVAVTISGTVTFNLALASESAMAANTGVQVKVERCDSSGAVLSTIINSEKGTELPVTASAADQNWTASPTSTPLSAGDRLKVTVFGNDAGGTMASGNTFSFGYGDDGTASFDSYVEFTEAITEAPAYPCSTISSQAVKRAAIW